MSLHSQKHQTHAQKEATFMRLFGGVGADSTSMDDSKYTKPHDMKNMPDRPPVMDSDTPVPVEHRPDPKLSDDAHVAHHPLTAQRKDAGVKCSSKEEAFVRLFDHQSREYTQAAAVENVDMSKLPDKFVQETYPEAEAVMKARGIDELKDGQQQPREQWLPKNMEKKLSARGATMHEGFMKTFSGPAHASS